MMSEFDFEFDNSDDNIDDFEKFKEEVIGVFECIYEENLIYKSIEISVILPLKEEEGV